MQKVSSLLFLIMITMAINAQHWIGPLTEIVFKSNEFLVKEQSFTHVLDSLVLNSQCVIEKQNEEHYFIMSFKKKGMGHYYIKLELCQLPVGDSSLGYFMINNTYFFIYGDIPNNLFIKSGKVDKFSYQRGILCIAEEFPIWEFDYHASILLLKNHHCF